MAPAMATAMAPAERVRITIRLPAQVVEALEAVAAAEGLSVSQVVGLFVRSGLRRASSATEADRIEAPREVGWPYAEVAKSSTEEVPQ